MTMQSSMQYPEKFWHLYVREREPRTGGREGIINDLTFDELLRQYVRLWKTGEKFTIGGMIIDKRDLARVKIVQTGVPLEVFVARVRERTTGPDLPDKYWPFEVSEGSTDYTNELLYADDEPEEVRQEPRTPEPKAFVVHGHDEDLLNGVARFIQTLGVEAIVLKERAHRGMTLIEKLEEHGRVPYAVIIWTADDLGRAKKGEGDEPRPRQNVVLELGYFIGRLGRENVCVLMESGLQMPSDLRGVGYHELDPNGGWRMELAKEMSAAGLPVRLAPETEPPSTR